MYNLTKTTGKNTKICSGSLWLRSVKLGTHSVVADSSVPQDSLADKRDINGSLQEKENKSHLTVLIAERRLI